MSPKDQVGLYTVDVGHGLCQLLLMQGRRAILIDGGGFSSRLIPMRFLERLVDWIELYVATHNDKDHVGAAISILNQPRYRVAGALRRALVVVDRPAHFPIPIIDYLVKREKAGTLERLMFGYLGDSAPLRPRLVFADRHSPLRLKLLHPRFGQALDSFQRETASSVESNRAGMVLRAEYGKATALITGDADCETFRRITEDYRFDLTADLLTLPHHGGRIPGTAEAWKRSASHVAPKFVVVSSGTAKTRVQATSFDPFKPTDFRVCCTQLTEGCHAMPRSFLPSVYSVAQLIGLPQASPSGGVACFGSSVAFLSVEGVSVLGIGEHQAAVEEKVLPTGTPQCLATRPIATATPRVPTP